MLDCKSLHTAAYHHFNGLLSRSVGYDCRASAQKDTIWTKRTASRVSKTIIEGNSQYQHSIARRLPSSGSAAFELLMYGSWKLSRWWAGMAMTLGLDTETEQRLGCSEEEPG